MYSYLYLGCGVISKDDYNTSMNWNRTWTWYDEETDTNMTGISVIPATCCYFENQKPWDLACPVLPNEENAHIEKGCYTKVEEFVYAQSWFDLAKWGLVAIFPVVVLVPTMQALLLLLVALSSKKKSEAGK